MSMSAFEKNLVLVIEDDVAIRETFAEILELEGLRVVQVENGLAAVRALEGGLRPSLILLDLMMPVMDGFAFRAEQLKNPAWSTIPVLVLSADVRMKEKLDSFKGVAYLRKPPDIDVLISKVHEHRRHDLPAST